MIGMFGKIHGHVVDIHRVGIFQPDAGAARHAGADAGLPGVKQRRQARFRDRLVEHIGAAVVRIESLHRGVKLEAADAELADEPARLAGADLALGRVDAGERDQHVAVRRRPFPPPLRSDSGDSRSRARHRPERSPRRCCARGNSARSLDRRRDCSAIEIDRHRGLQIVIAVVRMGAAGLLRMGVDVDRDQVVQIHEMLPFLLKS